MEDFRENGMAVTGQILFPNGMSLVSQSRLSQALCTSTATSNVLLFPLVGPQIPVCGALQSPSSFMGQLTQVETTGSELPTPAWFSSPLPQVSFKEPDPGEVVFQDPTHYSSALPKQVLARRSKCGTYLQQSKNSVPVDLVKGHSNCYLA